MKDSDTLGTVREHVREGRTEGVTCPACGQFAKEYRRTIHTSMARALIRIYNATGFHGQPGGIAFADVLDHRQIADAAKLRYWNLITENEVGWTVTSAGWHFARSETRVPRYAVVYNGDLLRLEGAPVTIKDCLGARFDYDALMRGDA